tara:strand:- start:164 stop:334 length:171 start_codon:yes stop_codon:yes gene_type:complete
VRVEKYIEADFQKAMAKARNELGKDAMLLSTRSTGVGKTATAAKIASRFALRHGRN